MQILTCAFPSILFKNLTQVCKDSGCCFIGNTTAKPIVKVKSQQDPDLCPGLSDADVVLQLLLSYR